MSEHCLSGILRTLGIGLVMAGILFTPSPAMADTTTEARAQTVREIAELIHETARRWNSQDYSTVLELWDPDEPMPLYLAEEQAGWFIGQDRLRAYLDPARPDPGLEALRETMYDIQVNPIAPDLAIAAWYMHFEMKRRHSKPMAEDVRVSAVFRRTPAGWRYIYWAESPKTATIYIKDLMQKNLSEDWNEFFEQARQRRLEVTRKKAQ